MNVFENFIDLFTDMNGRATIVWIAIIYVFLRKSIKSVKANSDGTSRNNSRIAKNKKRAERYGQKLDGLVKKLYKRKEIKQIMVGASISFLSFVLFLASNIIHYFINRDALEFSAIENFLFFVSIISACISFFLSLKEISLYLLDIAITGNSNYKTAKTMILIKVIYYILMAYWGGVLFIFGGENLNKPFYLKWSRILGESELVTGFLYFSYFLLLIATILLLFTLLSIVFSYDIKAEKISERLKFIAFNYFQIVLLLTGLVMCSAILFDDFEEILTEITIKGFLNCLYTVFLSLQDISIVYNEAVSVYGKIVLTICSSCNLLFIGMFVGTFLERN